MQWCCCDAAGTCLGCLIDKLIKDIPEDQVEAQIKFHYGTLGLNHYLAHKQTKEA